MPLRPLKKWKTIWINSKINEIEKNSSFPLCFRYDVCSLRSRLHDQFWSVVSEHGTEPLPQNCRVHITPRRRQPGVSKPHWPLVTVSDFFVNIQHTEQRLTLSCDLPIMCGDYEILVATNATAVRTFKLVYGISLTIFWIASVYFHWEGNKKREEWRVLEGGKRG